MPGFLIPHDNNCGQTAAISATGPSNVVETAREHRYLLEVLEPLGEQQDGLLLFLQKCTRPQPEFDKIVIHSAQDEIPRPGKNRWKDIDFTFYEKLSGDDAALENQCAKLIYDWWASTMLDINTGLFNPPSEYLKNAQLAMLDGAGEPVWTYHIYDSWPLKVTPSDLAYASTLISTISVTLCYSKAIEKKGAT